MAVVVNKRCEPFDVYIGRGSIWGNPFIARGERDRWMVIENYRLWLDYQLAMGEILPAQILALNGKKLGCYCKPKACHGDVIVNKLNELLAVL